jgi:hypothetical protein
MMNTKQLLLVAAATLCIAGLSGTANAQDESEDGHIFVVSTLQWPFNNLEEIFDLMEETQGLLEQNEYVLSRKVLSHYYAGAFSVMTITEYASLADIEKAGERGNELFEAGVNGRRDARGQYLARESFAIQVTSASLCSSNRISLNSR